MIHLLPTAFIFGRSRSSGRSVVHHRVCWSASPMLVSLFMLLNLVAMPMKAYISEAFPWTSLAPMPSFASFSSFNATTLVDLQARYNSATLPKGAANFADGNNGAQVLRQLLPRGPSIPQARCTSDFLVGKPGSIYYGSYTRDLLCAFAAANDTTVHSDPWDRRGSCMTTSAPGLVLGYHCIWLTAGDALHLSSPPPGVYTLTFAMAIAPYPHWYWTKFVYRVGTTVGIGLLLWRRYYKHCVALQRQLARLGHAHELRSGEYSYVISIGDPTAVVLTNPWVALAFFVDVWASFDTLSFAVLRGSQNEDAIELLVAFLYLSRAVWLAYFGLSVMSAGLKHWRKEHVFGEVDPTLVAIAVTIYGPLLTYFMGNSAWLLQVYWYLEECMVPTSAHGHELVVLLPCLIYTLSLTMAPLLFGLVKAIAVRWHDATESDERYSSLRFTTAKTRAIVAIFRLCQPQVAVSVLKLGGTIYALFDAAPRYKANPTISYVGTDCFVYCYRNGELEMRLRLSLLEALDVHASAKSERAAVDTREVSPFTMHELVLPMGIQRPGERKIKVSPTPARSVRLRRPREPSVWCL
ncbi:hypothetical protein SDRG_14179 [Saprolegnia diclina VS20]|uniref:Uncharacterized protein n=1 Tax=Saprolegnia diclina (strain VS20) TaxID=1156394 RepID=T0Q0N1_SAPDV|nr:hypothetical protein SDRG_14179 [Saprolegnia diclina VS20]EQC28086.1 hypothetical protein SDRG_14179 [Saprolegnia diclina VS20]|eukprot:XP_008618511.1 hypothetical protein SDRG_14179 [Saprolegnia diclina VS20]